MMKRGIKISTKKSQLEMSFGMIFSIILIIAFVAFAVYGIIMFLGISKCAQTGMFKEDLQNDIDRAYASEETMFTKDMNLPSQIEKICFINLSQPRKGEFVEEYRQIQKYGGTEYTMWFLPLGKSCQGQTGFILKHLDLNKMLEQSNPYCITNNKGKISITIDGSYGKLVVVR